MILAAAFLLPLLALACDVGEPEEERPADLPDAAVPALEGVGPVDMQLVPRTHEMNGFAVAFRGDFIVT
ncbi:MAG: hypothetical protein EA351_00870, partial [Gemmatimonadales bacterium]